MTQNGLKWILNITLKTVKFFNFTDFFFLKASLTVIEDPQDFGLYLYSVYMLNLGFKNTRFNELISYSASSVLVLIR